MLKKIISRMLSMSSPAWYIFIRGVQLCTVLLIFALFSLIRWGGSMYGSSYYYRLAFSLNETAQAVLLIAVLVSCIAEDIITQGK